MGSLGGDLRLVCSRRGDLGSLAAHARKAGYRADGVAEEFGVTPRMLRRLVAHLGGTSFKKWMVGLRLIEVRQRLLGDESIAEIADSVGFSHSKELAREFKKAHGETPSAYRKRERSIGKDR